VERVSWEDAVAFCRKLSQLPKEKAAGRAYRLPTEAEWEYACRGGAASPKPFDLRGKPSDRLSSRDANFDGEHPYGGAGKGPCLGRTCKVGSYKANGFGLYHMQGNLNQWCGDWYDPDHYARSPRKDPGGAKDGSSRVLRGGSWLEYGHECRAANRFKNVPDGRFLTIGFRVALGVGAKAP
jgi:formylglycine-generating enzyme required for sulfatase activity